MSGTRLCSILVLFYSDGFLAPPGIDLHRQKLAIFLRFYLRETTSRWLAALIASQLPGGHQPPPLFLLLSHLVSPGFAYSDCI